MVQAMTATGMRWPLSLFHRDRVDAAGEHVQWSAPGFRREETAVTRRSSKQRTEGHETRGFAPLEIGTALALLALPGIAGAHHSFAGFYDPNRILEIEGVITELSWFNPHGRMRLEVTDESGATAVWNVETGSFSVLRTRGVDPEIVQVGDRILLAGDAALRNETGIYGRQMLLADGREILLSIGVSPRWTDADTGELIVPELDERTAAEARSNAEGVFRVWGTVLDDPAAFPMYKGGYPLTEAGRATLAQWDATSAELNDCTPKAMPLIMITPYPIEFVRDGEDIVIRMEEDDAVRRIYMGDVSPPDEHTFLGFSTGTWEGETLVVETTHMLAELFSPEGILQSEDIRVIERFMPSADGERMDYRITISDPVTFTEDFELTRYFVWRPDLTVSPYDCVDSPTVSPGP